MSAPSHVRVRVSNFKNNNNNFLEKLIFYYFGRNVWEVYVRLGVFGRDFGNAPGRDQGGTGGEKERNVGEDVG